MDRGNSQTAERPGPVHEVHQGAAGSDSESRGRLPGYVLGGSLQKFPILDEEALLTTLAYVDMNVMAAGMAKTPEEPGHTPVKARVDHCREQGNPNDIVNQPADRTRRNTSPDDESFWLVPIHERREHGGTRAGMTNNTRFRL